MAARDWLISAMWGVATLSGQPWAACLPRPANGAWPLAPCLPLLVLQMLLVQRQLAPQRLLRSTPAQDGRIAGLQIVLLALSVLLVAAASVVTAPLWQWLLGAAGLLAGAAAIWHERRASRRLLPQAARRSATAGHAVRRRRPAAGGDDDRGVCALSAAALAWLATVDGGLCDGFARRRLVGGVGVVLGQKWPGRQGTDADRPGAVHVGPGGLGAGQPWQGMAALVVCGLALAVLGLGWAWPGPMCSMPSCTAPVPRRPTAPHRASRRCSSMAWRSVRRWWAWWPMRWG
ncbi:hypothetical protein [Comamonas sp. JC664]|uniref:hypothetical protein n=1 Tax=Comamonas sp. JC664 TaxID=2801917 RepID=UPI003611D8AE